MARIRSRRRPGNIPKAVLPAIAFSACLRGDDQRAATGVLLPRTPVSIAVAEDQPQDCRLGRVGPNRQQDSIRYHLPKSDRRSRPERRRVRLGRCTRRPRSDRRRNHGWRCAAGVLRGGPAGGYTLASSGLNAPAAAAAVWSGAPRRGAGAGASQEGLADSIDDSATLESGNDRS